VLLCCLAQSIEVSTLTCTRAADSLKTFHNNPRIEPNLFLMPPSATLGYYEQIWSNTLVIMRIASRYLINNVLCRPVATPNVM